MDDRRPLDEDSASDIFVRSDGSGRSSSLPKLRRVLAIEDSEPHRRLIELLLSESVRVNFQLTSGVRLADGLELLNEGEFDVVLLDLNLPDSRGLDTLHRVSSHSPHMPIVVLTGLDDEIVAGRAVREGAEDYLVKGEFDSDLLVRSVRYAIARHRSKVKLQQALRGSRTSETNLRNVIARSVDGTIVVDNRGAIQFSNPAAQALFGRSEDDLLQAPFGFPVEDCESSEIEIQRTDGQCVPVEMRVVDVNWEGKPCWLAVLRDLTLQKWALVEHAQLTAIVQSTDNAILSADLGSKFLTWNPGAEKIFGYTAEEAIGKHVSMLWPPEHHDQAAAMIERVKGGETVGQLETVRQRKDGGIIDVSISAFPICDQTGELVSIGGIVADITDRKRAQRDLEKKKFELKSAQAIQLRLLPQGSPEIPGFDIAGALHPAEYTAGDYYDFLPMGDGTMGFVVGDVSGHGLGPAMLMASTRAHLRSFVQMDKDVAEVLAHLNRALSEETKEEHFVTLMLAQLDCQTRSFVYASAGHSTGYVLDSSGEVKQHLPSTGVPLAIVPDADFPINGPIKLAPGDTVFFPTDGLDEARSPDGSFLGKEGVLEIVRTNCGRSAGEIVGALRETALKFCEPGRPSDDLTAVVIKVEPAV